MSDAFVPENGRGNAILYHFIAAIAYTLRNHMQTAVHI